MNHSPIGLLIEKIDILVPLRRPLSYFSKAAFVTNLKAEVKAPAAAKPARKDCWSRTWKQHIWIGIEVWKVYGLNKSHSKSWDKRSTWMNSGHIKDSSPTIPPSTCAPATPNAPTIAHKLIKGPIPPVPHVAKSTYYSSKVKLNRDDWWIT